jgi:hypothetical protein
MKRLESGNHIIKMGSAGGREMANLEGMAMKFTVIKNSDMQAIVSNYPGLEYDLKLFFKYLAQLRKFEGKKENKYLVINTDEPYADEVIEILKRHRHWG